MNSKGQSLVLFVLLIPLVLMILFMVYEIGRMTLIKHELDNINEIAIDYGLTKMEDENAIQLITDLINKNNSELDIVEVNIVEDKLYITLKKNIKGQASLFKNMFTVKSSYVGYMKDDKKIIEKDK